MIYLYCTLKIDDKFNFYDNFFFVTRFPEIVIRILVENYVKSSCNLIRFCFGLSQRYLKTILTQAQLKSLKCVCVQRTSLYTHALSSLRSELKIRPTEAGTGDSYHHTASLFTCNEVPLCFTILLLSLRTKFHRAVFSAFSPN